MHTLGRQCARRHIYRLLKKTRLLSGNTLQIRDREDNYDRSQRNVAETWPFPLTVRFAKQ